MNNRLKVLINANRILEIAAYHETKGLSIQVLPDKIFEINICAKKI